MQDPYQRPRRVAIVTTSYPAHAGDWSGHFVREEALELVREGHEVTVLTPRVGPHDAGVRVRALSHASGAFGPPGALARIAAFPPRAVSVASFCARVARALEREPFDRGIAHWAVPCAWPTALGGSTPLEVVSHGGDVRVITALPSAVRRRVVRALAERASVWRFVSRELAETLTSSLDDDLCARVSAITVVKAPALRVLDVSQRARAIRAELGAFDVSIGRLIASKRVERAIDHAARRQALLVVVGEGPERGLLERHAARAAARVRFVGDLPRHEALAYMAAAEALLFASEAEGCSTVVREAHALRTPVHVV